MSAAPAIDINLAKVGEIGNRLIDQLNALRETAPIYWSATQNAWIVTGHAEVAEGFRGQLPLTANRMNRLTTFIPEAMRETRIPYIMKMLPRFLISLDPPEQTRLRKLMMKAFSRKISESYREEVRGLIAETLDAAARAGEVEFVEDVARRVPEHMILRLMGLPDSYKPQVKRWTWALTAGLGGGGTTLEMLDECEAAMLEMREVFGEEIARRRADPREDFISMLATSEEDGERLTDDDILAACYLTLTAGNDTTANTITLMTAALAHDPAAWAQLRGREIEIEGAVMELMRHIAMSTTMARSAIEDFEWGGQQIRQGDLIYLMIAAANRDPSVFPDPEKLDLQRPQAGNMTFAPGLHFCIGHFLAKVQLTEFLPALVDRFDGVEVLDDHLNWATAVGFRGLRSLNVRLKPRAA